MLRALDLSDAQREQIRTITTQQRGDANAPPQKLAALQKQLHLAILSDTPDVPGSSSFGNASSNSRTSPCYYGHLALKFFGF